MTETRRSAVAAAKRVVLKVGTRVITDDQGRLALSRLFSVVEAAARLWDEGREVLIVSSGAVGLGIEALEFTQTPREVEERQACAAVGQTRLMGFYEQGFQLMGRHCGQVLLTRGDFHNPVSYRNIRATLTTLLRRGVVPIINENDAVSTEELDYVEGDRRHLFGDNDGLSALVATRLEASLLVLLTDVDGVFDRDPRQHAEARLLNRVDSATEVAEIGGVGSETSRGGMKSKIAAAEMVAAAGCHAVIASGRTTDRLPELFAGGDVGTWFPAKRATSVDPDTSDGPREVELGWRRVMPRSNWLAKREKHSDGWARPEVRFATRSSRGSMSFSENGRKKSSKPIDWTWTKPSRLPWPRRFSIA